MSPCSTPCPMIRTPQLGACRSEFLDRAFEAIESVGFIAQIHPESLIVVVAALVKTNLACSDRFSS